MRSIAVLWALHFHQPIGNFPDVLSTYTRSVCLPFLESLEKHPNIKISLHFSGPLLEYFDRAFPETLSRLEQLYNRDQIEFLGGGFYEPIFSLIPPEDAQGQIGKMSAWITKRFGTDARPTGAWLPESLWEPSYAQLLHEAGVRYTWVEDSLFHSSGLKPAPLFQPYRTEHLGHPLVLLPVQRAFSDQIPFKKKEEILGIIKQIANRNGAQTLILAQNGNQYGGWPGTTEKVYGEKLLEQWLQILETPGTQTRLPREVLAERHHYPLVHLVPGQIRSLDAAPLPVVAQIEYERVRKDLQLRFDFDRFDPFLRGGTWAGFLGKYPEVNHFHKKMLWLRRLIQNVDDETTRETALDALWAAQSHTAYWHAGHGGCYANYLRDAIHQKLIFAEKLLAEAQDEKQILSWQEDYDGDGEDEILLHAPDLSFTIKPNYGAALLDFNVWPALFNLGNTFRRRREAFHEALKDRKDLIEDWHQRLLFQDHLLRPGFTLDELSKNKVVELGDFVNQPYELIAQTKTPRSLAFTFQREGGLYLEGNRRPMTIQKTYQILEEGTLDVEYLLQNEATVPCDAWFLVELNYTPLDGKDPECRFVLPAGTHSCDARFEEAEVSNFRILNARRRFMWDWLFLQPARLFHFPIHTIEVEKDQPIASYQGSAFLLGWHIRLAAGEAFHVNLQSKVEMIPEES